METLGLDQAVTPKGLLLDFGGVIVTTSRSDGWQQQLAQHLLDSFAAAGVDPSGLTVESISHDLALGAKADGFWKNAMSRVFAPAELTYVQYWDDFVGCDWPAAPKAYVVEHAKELCRVMGEMKQGREMRNGLIELLDAADELKIPVAIVSNTLMGQVHRDWLIKHDILDRFVAEIYSDEVEVRKPNPEMIHLGARSVGLTSEECWYVGDNFDRDVLCGIRANVGGNVLMEDHGTYKKPYDIDVKPHIFVQDPMELATVMRQKFNG